MCNKLPSSRSAGEHLALCTFVMSSICSASMSDLLAGSSTYRVATQTEVAVPRQPLVTSDEPSAEVKLLPITSGLAVT